jgi:hypothetical protein
LPGGSTKNINKPAVARQTVPPVVTTSTPSSSERIGWTVLLTADSWNSSQRVIEFLDGLKNREANQEGIPFVPLLFQSS